MCSAPADTLPLTSLNIEDGAGIREMKFAVKAWSKGRPRVGLLQLPNCPHPIETPALLLSTRKGLPLFISPDLLPSLPSPDSHLLQMSPLHLYVFVSLPLLLLGNAYSGHWVMSFMHLSCLWFCFCEGYG